MNMIAISELLIANSYLLADLHNMLTVNRKVLSIKIQFCILLCDAYHVYTTPIIMGLCVYNPEFITPSSEELQTQLQDQHLQQSVNAINAHHGPTKISENKLRYYHLMKVNYTNPEKYLSTIQNPAI